VLSHKRKKKLSYRTDSADRRSLCRPGSLKVSDFGSSRKHVCDFLLVNDTDLHPISHCLSDIAQY